uniref:CobQ/CobB/MinD/ParA nucleotide binding domain-containing protein n=1 Tax=Candidatus Kentrum sp. TUN TaxID=2126343 RepID=A0A450ZA78_9GAMM|nr:MAG: CobQ/CobB/MinD/ParA nucleotide binding domain-containing protein [Candidatus Kentron sp. TUN]
MRIISFFSFKGGVGRTALLTNLGAHWAARGRVVALMDLDLIAPGISYSPLLGPYLDQRAVGLGMSDLLAAYHDRKPEEKTFKFLPPSLLLREMKLPEGGAPGGRLLAIGAGSPAGGEAYAKVAPAPAAGIVRAVPRAESVSDPDASNTEPPDAPILRSLAKHIRDDLAGWRTPGEGGNVDSPDAATDTAAEPADSGTNLATNRPIDYLLIDARTGFAELVDLGLGYLADHMVLVSGLNDQNLQGLRLTLRALWEQQRVPLDEMPTLVTVVFSPIPAGEDDAVLAGLHKGRQTLLDNLRYTRAGQRELAPGTFDLHYTPLLAISDECILPGRTDSLYGKEVRTIADHLAGEAIDGERFQEELGGIARETLRIVEEFGKRSPIASGPTPSDRLNPFTDLPAWHWPLGDDPDSRTRRRRLSKLVGKRLAASGVDTAPLLNRLAWDISLDSAQKEKILESLVQIGKDQREELIKAMEGQRARSLSLWQASEHRQQLMRMLVKTRREWAVLVLEDEPAADRALHEYPIPHFDAWPEYWLAIADQVRIRAGKDQAVLDAVDQAIGRAKAEETPELAELLMTMIPEDLDTPLQSALEARARRIAPEHLWLDFLAAYRLLKGPQKDPAAAQALLKPLLATPPQDARKCFDLGGLVAQELPEMAAEAETMLRKSIELDPTSASPWNNLGNLLSNHSDRHAEAEAAFRKAMELDPELAGPCWYNLGNLLQGYPDRHAEAEATYRKAMELDPTLVILWHNLGNLLSNYPDRHAEAEAAYRKAMELDPKSALPWNGLGNLLKKGYPGRHAEAEAVYRKAMELDPKDALSWNGLGALQRDWWRDCKGALASFRSGLERVVGDKKDQAYLRINLAHTLQLLGRPARMELETALTLFGEQKGTTFDNINALWLALALEDAERTAKYVATVRELAEAGYGGEEISLVLAFAEWLDADAEKGGVGAHSSPQPATGAASEADFIGRMTHGLKDWTQYWDYIQRIYFLCGFRAGARAAGQAVVRALLALPSEVTDKYPDEPRPDWRERYLPFANGESDGAGDPRDRHLFCRDAEGHVSASRRD